MDFMLLLPVLFVLGFFVVPSIIVIVPGKTAKILETFGKPHAAARMPGLSFKWPMPITTVKGSVNLQLREIGADVDVKTKDNAFMKLPVKVQFRASDNPQGAVKAFYELEDPEQQISSYVLNIVRQTASGMSMEDLYQNRNSIEVKVQEDLQERFTRFGYAIANVLVDEPQPSPEVRDSFNRVIASIREMEAAKNVAEAKRIELVGIAQAEKESKQLQGEGIAAMREAVAKGMNEAMKNLSEAGLETRESLSLLMDTNRLDTMGLIASHGNMVVVDMENKANQNLTDMMVANKATGNK